MRLAACAVCILLAPRQAAAQDTSPDTIAPMAVVRELFSAVKARDSARMRAVFHP